jgi:hypothetical protein
MTTSVVRPIFSTSNPISDMKKITELDTIAGVRNVFRQRFDHVRMEGLMRKAAQPNVVYKLKRHHMKLYKRNLHSPEVPFI